MKKEIITLRVDKELKEFIDRKSNELNFSRTDFIVNSILNKEACYVDKLKNVTSVLINISNVIAQKECKQKDFYTYEDIRDIKEGVANLWRMLK